MQNKFEKYQRFTLQDFLMDEDFIHWTKDPDEHTDQFWNEFISQNPQHQKNIKEAKLLIASLDTSIPEVADEIKTRVWESIDLQSGRAKVIHIKNRQVWVAAAAVVVLLLTAAGYFYLDKKPVNPQASIEQAKTPIKNDLAPGGNKAILTLANGSQIILSNAQNGALAQQGNTKVVKLDDGKLAYRQDEITVAPVIEYNTVSTPRGGQYQLTLSDGSKVWLNAASAITFPTAFAGKERKVEIKGEAYFEVTHDASKPFEVTVNGMQVAVLGTHFNINAYDDEGNTKTTLLEGSVKVSKGNLHRIIVPGEQAVINNLSDIINVNNDANLDAVIAWKNGKFYFDHSNIRTVMNQISRWYNVDIEYSGNVSKIFGGTISRNVSASNVFRILEATGGVHFKIEGKKVIVEP